MKIILISFLTAFLLCFSGMFYTWNQKSAKITRGMYYWKTNLYLDESDKQFIKNQRIEKLYVKIMDISWNATYKAHPITANDIERNLLADTIVEIIPVVFITNETLKYTKAEEIDTLAKKVVLKIKQLCGKGFEKTKELQIDFDWSPKTKTNYFELLKKIKLTIPNHILSVTLRLHQLKNKYETGIPPADRAMLMLYNMGKVANYNESNSILNIREAKTYLSTSPYALPIDFVLPLFDWAVKFSANKQFESILYNIKANDLDTMPQFKKLPNGNYQFISDYYNIGYNYFNHGDEIRCEGIEKNALLNLSKLCQQQINTKNYTVSFFEFKNSNLNPLDSIVYEEVFHNFN